MLTVSAAAARVGVCTKTIRRWDNRGLLRCFRTRGGHRRVPLSEVERVISEREPTADSHMTYSRTTIVYARVSSHGQKASGDLDRQVRELLARSGEASPLVLTDVGSLGLEDTRVVWRTSFLGQEIEVSSSLPDIIGTPVMSTGHSVLHATLESDGRGKPCPYCS